MRPHGSLHLLSIIWKENLRIHVTMGGGGGGGGGERGGVGDEGKVRTHL